MNDADGHLVAGIQPDRPFPDAHTDRPAGAPGSVLVRPDRRHRPANASTATVEDVGPLHVAVPEAVGRQRQVDEPTGRPAAGSFNDDLRLPHRDRLATPVMEANDLIVRPTPGTGRADRIALDHGRRRLRRCPDGHPGDENADREDGHQSDGRDGPDDGRDGTLSVHRVGVVVPSLIGSRVVAVPG